MEYSELLKRARKNLPESVFERERFEFPKVRGHLEGNKTIISNFFQIAAALRREPDHLLKFILKELATPGEIRRSHLVLGAKVSASRINEKIKQYTDEFVFCKECGKPHFPGLVSTYCMECSSCFGTLISGGSLSDEQRQGIAERKAEFAEIQR